MIRKTGICLLGILILASTVSGQSATISNVNPASKSVTIGQSFSVDVSYTTSSVNSCTLGVIGSSLPSNWESSGQLSVDTTSGSTSTATSPKITTSGSATETDVKFELVCSSQSTSPRDTSSVHVTAKNPPFLEGDLKSTDSIDVEKGETYTVEFSVSNTGSSKTESARATISSPDGYSHPSTATLREAGQEDGVIRAGKSAGTSSFEFTAGNGFSDGALTVDLTSSEIGVTESFEVELNTPSSGSQDSSGPAAAGGGAAGGASPIIYQLEPGQPSEINFQDKPLSGIDLEVNNPVNLNIGVKEVGKPENLPSPEIQVNRYIEISANASDSAVENAKIGFQVSREWMESNDVEASQVRMLRYTDSWQRLPTSMESRSTDHVEFTADSPGFSYFAVGSEKSTNSRDDEESTEDAGERSNQSIIEEEEDQNSNTQTSLHPQDVLVPAAAGTVLIALLTVLVLKRDEIVGSSSTGKKETTGETVQKLEAVTERVTERAREGNITAVDRHKVTEMIDQAESLVDQDRYREAENVMEQIEEILENTSGDRDSFTR